MQRGDKGFFEISKNKPAVIVYSKISKSSYQFVYNLFFDDFFESIFQTIDTVTLSSIKTDLRILGLYEK